MADSVILIMRRQISPWFGLVFILMASLPTDALGQADPFNFRFSSGQAVAPFFDGWSRNSDGSLQMHFGYINRNHVEEVHIPIGANNRMEPGALDQGQPTFFYPRVYRQTFSVRVSSDWGEQDLVWSLAVQGELHKAIGSLDPVWEIDPILRGREATEEQLINQPPRLTVTSADRVIRLPNPLAMTASVSDDGLPTAPPRSLRARRARGQETPPTLQPQPEEPRAPVNVPVLRTAVRPSQVKIDERLTITWTVWRGPASVQVVADSPEQSPGATTTMTATFSEPGEYVLRAELSDGHLIHSKKIPATVR